MIAMLLGPLTSGSTVSCNVADVARSHRFQVSKTQLPLQSFPHEFIAVAYIEHRVPHKNNICLVSADNAARSCRMCMVLTGGSEGLSRSSIRWTKRMLRGASFSLTILTACIKSMFPDDL